MIRWAAFVFRTTGFNCIRTLAARLQYFQAISGNRLACLPLELRLRGKSTRQSHGSPIYYVDITVRGGVSLEEALADAKRADEERKVAGFDQVALDAAARLGFGNGAFEDTEDDGGAVVDEFFPASTPVDADMSGGNAETQAIEASAVPAGKPSLSEKLEQRVRQSAPVVLAEPDLP